MPFSITTKKEQKIFNENLRAAYKPLIENPKHTEDYVTRYVMIIFSIFFSPFHWNLVPQYRTENQKFPDVAIESLERNKKNPAGRHIPRIFVEFKSGSSHENPKIQLETAIKHQHGNNYKSRGILIAVKGFLWKFMIYQLVKVPHKRGNGVTVKPIISNLDGETQDEKYLDMTEKDDFSKILFELHRISRRKFEPKDISFMLENASRLSKTFSPSSTIEEENKRLSIIEEFKEEMEIVEMEEDEDIEEEEDEDENVSILESNVHNFSWIQPPPPPSSTK